jgi:hypothetical protein
LHGVQQDINQGVLQAIILVHDEGNQVQVPIGVRPPRHLEDLRFEHTLRVVPYALGGQIERLEHGLEVAV